MVDDKSVIAERPELGEELDEYIADNFDGYVMGFDSRITNSRNIIRSLKSQTDPTARTSWFNQSPNDRCESGQGRRHSVS